MIPSENLSIETMTPHDWPAVCAIYEEGIAAGNATFETSVPEWPKWDAAHRPTCRFVAREHALAPSAQPGEVLGWAALSPVSSRQVYAGVAEVSVYVAARARGRGIGSMLLRAIIEASEREGIWTLQSSTFPENTASIALQKKHGFRIVGTRQRIAKLNGVWRDTVLLERRSEAAGCR